MEKVIINNLSRLFIISSLYAISCLYSMEELDKRVCIEEVEADEPWVNEQIYNSTYKPRGATPLHAAIDYNRPIEVIETLLEVDGDVNTPDNKKRTPLHFAAGKNNDHGREIITLLLKAGAELDAQNEDGDTPLYQPACNGRVQNCKLMLCQPPVVTMTPEIREALFTFLCIHKHRPKSPVKKLQKNVILLNIFPYLCPWFPFTDQLVGEYVDLHLQKIKRILLMKNNDEKTALEMVRTNGWAQKIRGCKETATLCDPEKVKQHAWLVEKNIRALNPHLKQIEEKKLQVHKMNHEK